MFLDDSKILIIHFLGEKVINGSRLFCAKNVRKINNKKFHRRLARAHVQYSTVGSYDLRRGETNSGTSVQRL